MPEKRPTKVELVEGKYRLRDFDNDDTIPVENIPSEFLTQDEGDARYETTSKVPTVPDIPNGETKEFVLKVVDVGGTQTETWVEDDSNFDGDYSSLINKPVTITPAQTAKLATVETNATADQDKEDIDGLGLDYSSLTNKPEDITFLDGADSGNKKAVDFTDNNGDITATVDLGDRVEKVAGKELSTNDFTDVTKTKVDTIAPHAEVNVKSNWDATSGDSQILNKPDTITTAQASAITTNSAKTGITSEQVSAITANTAKTGITSAQASAITANSAKVTYPGPQVLTGYLGDWDSTRQYDENDLVDLGGIIYRNNEIFISEGYSAGSTEMLIQTDSGTVTFIASIRFEGNTVSSAISINDDSVTNLGGGNYSVRIGNRLWTSTGVSQNTNSLSATRDEDSFTLRLDERATIGESPTTNPEYWERITTTAVEIAAIGTNTDNITANATAIGNITEGFEEYNATKDTANEYAVNDIVWYKHDAGIGQEINLFWKFTTSLAAGVPTVDAGAWELMTLDNAERAAIADNTAAIGTNTANITANATAIGNIDIGNGTITIEQNGNSVGAFTTNQSGDDTIKLLDTTTTVINTTVVNNATEYVKDTFYALATQIKFTDTDGNVHYYEKYGEPEFYSGVWASIDPYIPTRIVSHNGFYYVASGNGATPGQEPNTGAVDGDGEQAWVLIDINPVDYSNTWKPLVPNHFEISANNGAATTATLNTLDIDGTNFAIPAGGTGTSTPDFLAIAAQGKNVSGFTTFDITDTSVQYVATASKSLLSTTYFLVKNRGTNTTKSSGWYTGTTATSLGTAVPTAQREFT